jgi:hypothetical protein
MDERRVIAGRDAVDRALVNGTLGLLADEIQWIYWQAGQPCDHAMAEQIAAEKIAGRIKLPPDLKPDHVQRCPRCGRAHLMPLTDAEKLSPGQPGWRDPVERLCGLARGVVDQDYVSLQELPLGDATNTSTLIEVADAQRGQEATTGGGRRLPSGTPDEDGGGGHQGTGVGSGPAKEKKRRRRIATGPTILGEVEDELRDRLARQADETALTEKKLAWMTTDHGRASERQQEARYMIHVLGLSQQAAADRMKVSKTRIQRLLADYAKNSR